MTGILMLMVWLRLDLRDRYINVDGLAAIGPT